MHDPIYWNFQLNKVEEFLIFLSKSFFPNNSLELTFKNKEIEKCFHLFGFTHIIFGFILQYFNFSYVHSIQGHLVRSLGYEIKIRYFWKGNVPHRTVASNFIKIESLVENTKVSWMERLILFSILFRTIEAKVLQSILHSRLRVCEC